MRRCRPVIAVIVLRLSWVIRCLRVPVGAAVVLVIAMINSASPASAAAPKPARLLISPMSHLYGSTLVGGGSAGQSYAVTNSGQTTSGPVSVALTGADAGDFVVDADSCTATLAAGTTCSVTVHFAPTAVGWRTSNLAVTATPGGTVTSSLKGTAVPGAKLTISPTSHQYGSVVVGASSSVQTYTVTNTGAGTSGAVSLGISGTSATDFVQDASTCAGDIAAGSSCTVSVHFTPGAAGARSATLSATAAPGGTVSSALHGSGAAKALLSIAPSSFNYGPVVIGTTTDAHTFTVTNSGLATSGPVTVAVAGTDGANFVVDSTTCGAKLAAGSSCTVTAHYTPTAPGSSTAALSASASPGGSATSSLAGAGTTPASLSISPTMFDFGSVAVGFPSGDQTFTIANNGQQTSGTFSLNIDNGQGADFVVDATTCGNGLPGGGSCTVSLYYLPTATGVGSGTLSAIANPGGEVSATLQGAGITPASLSISPSMFDFGSVAPSSSSGDQTFIVTNTGQAVSGPVTLASTGSNAGDFVIDSTTCGEALSGGSSCTIAVRFTPSATGSRAAGLTAAAAPGGSAVAALQGEGLAPATLSISPNTFDFGATAIGVPSTGSPFVVTNTGQLPSGPVTVEMSGPNASDFSVRSSTCGAPLAAGDSCTVIVQFTDYYTETDTATLTATASPGTTTTAALQAEAVPPAYFRISSANDFGSVLVGNSSSAQTITVTNIGGLTSGIVGVTTGGTNPSDFVVDTNTCNVALVAGASCSFNVHFSPGALGSRTATVTAGANPGGNQSTTLGGTGVGVVTVSPANFTFPNQRVGTTSAAENFVLTNYGSTPLTSFAINSSDPTDFPITTDTCVGATLNAGSNCTISVTFHATATQTQSATMNASLVDPGNLSYNATFVATGTGFVPPPDLSTTMTVVSQSFSSATVNIAVTNLGPAASVPATMTIDVDPTQSFSYSAGAGTDCTAQIVNGFDSQFTCPVPVIASGQTYTRQLQESNLSGQGPRYVQNEATTIMPGDGNSSNNTGYTFVTFS